jgi:hypothetical protein
MAHGGLHIEEGVRYIIPCIDHSVLPLNYILNCPLILLIVSRRFSHYYFSRLNSHSRIVPGFGMYREVAAYILDDGFSGVPPTALAKVRHRFLRNEAYMNDNGWDGDYDNDNRNNEVFLGGYKLSSVQSYVRHEGVADDMGPSMFDTDDCLRIAVLDLRLCNLDRHGGNILVCSSEHYIRGGPYMVRVICILFYTCIYICKCICS